MYTHMTPSDGVYELRLEYVKEGRRRYAYLLHVHPPISVVDHPNHARTGGDAEKEESELHLAVLLISVRCEVDKLLSGEISNLTMSTYCRT